jgi:hypothetical protein
MALHQGLDVIIDDTNLRGDSWAGYAKFRGVEREVVSLRHEPISTCVHRDRQRKGRAHVGRAVIERMAVEAGMIDLSRHSEVAIVDVDGTLANLDHRLPFIQHEKKDYHSFFTMIVEDEAFDTVASFVRELYEKGYYIIILSGRPSTLPEDPSFNVGTVTSGWLDLYNIPNHLLLMRRGGDYRPDVEAKREIWRGLTLKGRLNPESVKVVLDDRDSICELWREVGLPLVKVDHGRVLEISDKVQIPITI